MKIAERIVMVLLLFVLIGGSAWLYFSIQYELDKEDIKKQEINEAVARGEYEKPIITTEESNISPDDWHLVYPVTYKMFVGEAEVQASVADSLSTRIKGLSGTPFLPTNVVKLFAFGSAGPQSIWMKDMNYPIDIIWADEEGKIVHIEENVAPETYPDSFSSPIPAWYVVETSAGFVASNTISTGDEIVLPVQ